MNLRKFLNEIDSISEHMSVEELQAFVHENGRTLPERLRGDYISTLKTYSSLYEEKVDAGKNHCAIDFESRYEQIAGQLAQISEGEIYLAGKWECGYDDWYDGNDELILSDPDGIADTIFDACQYVHGCVDCEEYAFGYRLANMLVELKIFIDDEDGMGSYDNIQIKDFDQYEIGNIDYKEFVIDGLYCGYQANDIKERPEVLYRMIESAGLKDVTLEMIMQNGNELTDIGKLLPDWIAYLGKQRGLIAQGLLNEALELTGNREVLLDSARRYYDMHPYLYEQYIDEMCKDNKSLEDILMIGDEALEKIDRRNIIRSRIAKTLGIVALEHNLKDKMEGYWIEAFRSDINVTNFIIIFSMCENFNVYLADIRRIYHKMYKMADRYERGNIWENRLESGRSDIDNIYMLAVLGGEFHYVKENVMNVKEPLGWTSTFMKCGLAAFILLLYDGDDLQIGGREMCRRIVLSVGFDKEEYERCTGKHIDSDNVEFFWYFFKGWKRKNLISETEKLEIIKWLDKIIEKRVKGIMEANRRNYYGECAAYIAALGEALETQGEAGAKQKILMKYKQLYSARRNFQQKLRNYGMIDTRKGRK